VQFTPTSLGVHVVTAVATDNTGNVNTSSPITFTTTASGAPIVTITTPAAGFSFPVNTTQNITATASPSGGGSISSVTFYANGVQIGAPVVAFPYTVAWTPTNAGPYTLTAVAVDTGVPGTSAPVSVNVTAGLPPNGAITSPSNNANLTIGQQVAFTATASVNPPALSLQVDFRVNNVSIGAPVTVPTVPGGSTYALNYTPPALGNVFQLTAVITDNAGGVFTTPAVTFNVVSLAGPTVSVTAPTAGSIIAVGTPTSVTAAAAAVAPGATVQSVQLFANGVAIGSPVTTAPYTSTWIPTAGGNYSLTARAIDSNNTVTTSAPVMARMSSAAAAPNVRVTICRYAGWVK